MLSDEFAPEPAAPRSSWYHPLQSKMGRLFSGFSPLRPKIVPRKLPRYHTGKAIQTHVSMAAQCNYPCVAASLRIWQSRLSHEFFRHASWNRFGSPASSSSMLGLYPAAMVNQRCLMCPRYPASGPNSNSSMPNTVASFLLQAVRIPLYSAPLLSIQQANG